MNDKEIAELRRRLRPEKNGITHVRGCYVNESREVLSIFDQPLALMEEEEAEKFLTIFRRALSGTLGKNLLDIPFATRQVGTSEEHKLLMTLRDTALSDADAAETLFHRIIDALSFEGNYGVLLCYDSYDVPYRAKDGAQLDDSSETVFPHVLCAVCPVKMTKAALHYDADNREFHKNHIDWIVSAPELGFLFPAFDDRATNLYDALYYTRSAKDNHPELIAALFGAEAPLPAETQRDTFCAMLSGAMEDGCSLQVVKAVHAQLSDMIAEHKANKVTDPLVLSKREVRAVLETCGVKSDDREKFSQEYDAEFGADAELSPRNLVNPGQMEVRTPDVVIRVNPDRADLIETRVIGGEKYILIHADDAVEVNGVSIEISGS